MEAVNFDQYEKTLADQQFLGGQLPTNDDREAYEKVKNTPPTAATHPNTFAWFVLVGRFTDKIREAWGGAAAAKGGKAAPAKKEEPKKDEPKKEEKADEDDMDLFGSDDDDEAAKAAEALREAKAKAHNEKKAAKGGVVIAKSIVLFEVKPYEAETDLDKLAEKILAIEMDGLFWKTEYKKEPIAYGVEKLIIGCVIEDLKVSTDDLVEQIEGFDEEVQSVDIKSFNKI